MAGTLEIGGEAGAALEVQRACLGVPAPGGRGPPYSAL